MGNLNLFKGNCYLLEKEGIMMKNTRHFGGLSIFIVTAIVFCISTSALAIDPVMPGSKVAPQTNQQLQLQKSEMKILNPDIYMQTFALTIIGGGLSNLINNLDSWVGDNNTARRVFVMRENELIGALGSYNGQLNECLHRPYTFQEQQAAGCLPNDTVQQCSDKLLKRCIGPYASHVKGDSELLQNMLQDLISRSTELANKLKALSNELQQKYPGI
jgi:hypothetical protein